MNSVTRDELARAMLMAEYPTNGEFYWDDGPIFREDWRAKADRVLALLGAVQEYATRWPNGGLSDWSDEGSVRSEMGRYDPLFRRRSGLIIKPGAMEEVSR